MNSNESIKTILFYGTKTSINELTNHLQNMGITYIALQLSPNTKTLLKLPDKDSTEAAIWIHQSHNLEQIHKAEELTQETAFLESLSIGFVIMPNPHNPSPKSDKNES